MGEGKEEGDTVDHVAQNWNDCGVDNYGTSIWIFFFSLDFFSGFSHKKG